MIDSMHVLDVLRERGYVPQDDADAGEGWFDLPGAQGTVRAILSEESGGEIYLFTGPWVCEWTVRFSGAPGAVFLATLDAAEREAGITREEPAMSTSTTTPDGVTTVTLADGRRLSYGPAATETGGAAEGFDWTRYSTDDEIEAQDWAPTGEQMTAIVAQFAQTA